MSIYDKASLVLIPSGTKTSKVYSQKPVNGDGDFTFSRSTAATRVNADGNIEKETQNLLLQSNNFTSTWNVDTGITFTSGQSGYDGSSDAWKMDKTASDFLAIRQTPTYSGVVTFSLYAKQGTLRYLNFYTPTANAQIWFDLQTGGFGNQAGTYIKNKIEDVGGGWYRCSVTYNASSGGELRLYPTSSSAGYTAVAGNIYIQDAQLEQGLVARDYIETTTAAVEGGITDNVPRLDYTDSSCPALLLEPQRTNSHLHSEYIAGWTTPTSQGFESNSIVSPEGVQNATKIINTNSSSSWIRQLPSVTIGQKQVISCFAKEGNRDIFNITYYDVTDGDRFFNYNLSTQTISGNGLSHATYVDSNIIDYGNGWYRCYVVITAGNATPQIQMAVGTNRIASANDYIYLWGAQHEQNASYATSYIPTYGTSVTRNADGSGSADETATPFILDSDFGLYWEGVINGTLVYPTFFSGGNYSSGSDYRSYLVYNGNTFQLFGVNEVLTAQKTIALTLGAYTKILVKRVGSTIKWYVNGTEYNNASGTTTTIVKIRSLFGSSLGAPNHESVTQALIFETALTDQEAIDLTTI